MASLFELLQISLTTLFQFCFPFAMFVTFLYALIYNYVARETFDASQMEYCNTISQCLVTVLHKSLQPAGGGHNYR